MPKVPGGLVSKYCNLPTWYDWLVGAAFSVAMVLCGVEIRNPSDVFSKTAGISATLLGFVLTNMNLVISQFNSDRLKLIRKHRRARDLFDSFGNSLCILGYSLTLSVVGFFINWSINPGAGIVLTAWRIAPFALLVPFLSAFMAMLRCFFIVRMIVAHIAACSDHENR